ELALVLQQERLEAVAHVLLPALGARHGVAADHLDAAILGKDDVEFLAADARGDVVLVALGEDVALVVELAQEVERRLGTDLVVVRLDVEERVGARAGDGGDDRNAGLLRRLELSVGLNWRRGHASPTTSERR